MRRQRAMHRGRRVAVALVALAGCGGGERSGTGAIDVDALPGLAAVEVQRLGSVEDPDTGFAWVAGAAVDEDGRVYVADGQDLRIRVYGADGRLQRLIGRRGEGPGEFRFPPTFGVVGDTLWAVERMGAPVITLFDLRGAVLSTGNDEMDVPWVVRYRIEG